MKPFIIAEAGINHNGNIELAKKLADASADAGANAVKFQTFRHIRRLEKYELSPLDFMHLKEHCDLKGIMFMSTPHTFEAIHFLDKIVSMHKIASTYLGNPNFLMEVASKKKPILLSTGDIMQRDGKASIEKIKSALKYIPLADVTIMHCVSKYPCEFPHYAHIKLLEGMFPDNVIGLSDHSKNTKVPIVPVIEKHIMLDDIVCPDESVSLTPSEFKEMVKFVKGET